MAALSHLFKDDGSIPNNPVLPALVYLGAFKGIDAEEAQERLRANGWQGTWVNGVYPFHHYHSNAHEALAVTRGTASLLLGGERGLELEVHAGDVLVLPAGTGHKRISASPDFEVVGAYPPGQEPDLLRGEPGERPAALERIRRVPLPGSDPVSGGEGRLRSEWSARP